MRNFTGQRFGNLVAVRPTDKRTKSKNIVWECMCDCGNTTYVPSNHLGNGHTTSCGCSRRVANTVYSIGNVGICIIGNMDSYFWFDLCDLELVLSRTWTMHSAGYAVARSGESCAESILFHRVVIGASDGIVVDHINGDVRDNRRCNLRLCTQAQNAAHRTCGVKGYYRRKSGKYKAVAADGGIALGLGMYDTPEEAHEAYMKHVKSIRGEFAPHERVIYYPGNTYGRDR